MFSSLSPKKSPACVKTVAKTTLRRPVFILLRPLVPTSLFPEHFFHIRYGRAFERQIAKFYGRMKAWLLRAGLGHINSV
jgi:hypothetical protein